MPRDFLCALQQEPICRGIKEILGCFEKYSKVSGAKLNLDKCKGLALGCLAGEGEFEIEGIKFQECVEILGINFGCNIDTKNWPEITQNIKVTLNMHSQRHLSLRGKAAVANTMATSKLWYTGRVLDMPRYHTFFLNPRITALLETARLLNLRSLQKVHVYWRTLHVY